MVYLDNRRFLGVEGAVGDNGRLLNDEENRRCGGASDRLPFALVERLDSTST